MIREIFKQTLFLLTFFLFLFITIFFNGIYSVKTAISKNKEEGNYLSSFTIADPAGDWGFPSPYGHYQRGPGYIRMSFIFDTLIWKDNNGFIPALAEKWEFLKNENAYIFTLKKGIKWHDGKLFKAPDVVFTFDYIKKHPYKWVSSDIVDRVEAIDDNTVKIFLSNLYAPFLHTVAATMPILPVHIWKEIEDPISFQKDEALIGTGPYKLLDYNKEQGTYLYGANSDYYLGTPKVKQLKFVKMRREIGAAALRQKKINLAQVPGELIDGLKKENFIVLIGLHDWGAKLLINHKKGLLSQKEFRHALAYAIDLKQIVEITQRGHAIVSSPGLVPKDNPFYNSNTKEYPYDQKKAEDIIKNLGYLKEGEYFVKDGKILEFELLVSGTGIGVPGAPSDREGELIKEQLRKVGIKINLRSLDAKTLDSLVREWKFDLALSGHGGLGGEPEVLNRMIAAEDFNSARYDKNEELNDLLNKQVKENDAQNRQNSINRIQEIFAEELPCLYLYNPTWYWVHDGSVNLYYTKQGIAIGVPLPMNKISFVK